MTFIALGLEAIAGRLELEAIATRVAAIGIRLEAINIIYGAV